MSFPNWHQRPEKFDPETNVPGRLDGESFIRVADQFISLANQRNRKIDATELQLVMLFAAARYAAHVGKNVIDLDDQEEFINLTAQYPTCFAVTLPIRTSEAGSWSVRLP